MIEIILICYLGIQLNAPAWFYIAIGIWIMCNIVNFIVAKSNK